MEVPQNTKNRAIPLLGMYPQETMMGIFIFSNSLLKFSVCSFIFFLSLLSIFMTISLNSLSGKLLGWPKSSSFSTRWHRKTQMNFGANPILLSTSLVSSYFCIWNIFLCSLILFEFLCLYL